MKKRNSNIGYGFINFLTLFIVFSYATQVYGIETKPFQTIKVEEIERKGTEFLWEKISEEEDNFEVQVNFQGMDIIVPEGKVEFEFEINGRRQLKTPRIPLVLKIKVDGKIKRKVWLNSKAKFFKEVLKTTRLLKNGTIIAPDDIEFFQVDEFREGKRAFIDPDEVIGLKVVRNIEKNKVIKLNMVRKPVLVKQGDHVLIMAKMGVMKITTPGVAKEKGFRGSMIRVLNAKSKKVVYGRVVDSNIIEVNF
jgi:flagellar basal body P-ring formation protein FlgA